MAFVDTAIDRLVLEGACPVEVTLAENVNAGDPLGISSGNTWVLSADAAVEHPVLIAGVNGVVGETITAFGMAVIKCTTSVANYGAVGDTVAVDDTGIYVPSGGGLPDIGFVSEVSADLLNTTIVVFPMVNQLIAVRA
jgi:hypothetical protein